MRFLAILLVIALPVTAYGLTVNEDTQNPNPWGLGQNTETLNRGESSLDYRPLLDLLDSENELFSAACWIEEVRFTGLFTQYRIKATMGALLKSQGVIAPMAAAPLDEVKANVS